MIEEYLSEKHKKKKQKRQKFFWIVTAIIIVLIIIAAFWFFFRSPAFRVKQVIVVGNSTVASSDIVDLLNSSVLQNHSFVGSLLGLHNMLMWPRSLASSEIATIPELSTVSIAKDYWDHTITATVMERQPFAIWCAMPAIGADGNPTGDEACYWFDDTGMMFENAFDTEGNAIFAVHDYSQNDAGLGKLILPDVFIPNLISILNVLKQSDLNVKEIALNDISLQELDISTYNGPEIYFSLRFPADEDLPVLQSLMAKPGFGKLQYVDFRVENRAYYK